jgi:membrane protein
MRLSLSTAIIEHTKQYGPIGVVFVILTVNIAFSVVMLGGAALGHVIVQRRQADHS